MHLLFCCLLLAAPLRAAKPPAAPAAKSRCAELDEFRRASDIYRGIGYSEEKDLGLARQKAVDAALADLSASISVRVEVAAKDFIGYDRVNDKSTDQESYERLLKTYVDQRVNDAREREFLDCPRPGTYAVVKFVDKRETDERMKEDIEVKKTHVVDALSAADAAVESGRPVEALKGFIEASGKLESFFEGMPVKASLKPSSSKLDLGVYARSRIEGIIGSVTLKPLNERVFYTVDGKPKGLVVVTATLNAAKGGRAGGDAPAPVANLPLTVAFSKGQGRLAGPKVVTDVFGKAELGLESVDPSSLDAALEVSVDSTVLSGLPARSDLPRCAIALARTRTVAFAVRFANGGKTEAMPSLEEGVRKLILEAGYGAVKAGVEGGEAGPALLGKARQTNADYLLAIEVAATHEADLKMYAAQARSSVALYRLPDGSQESADAGPGAKGFGASGSGAGWHAAGKLEKGVLNLVRDGLSKLR
ncbi:MAG: hypothetical protein HY927_03690 [Elusimicrobia bacterium]|nr:hypothetical protein [Elusimicrobiota bacterium]